MTKIMSFLFEIILIIINMKHINFFIVYIVILMLNILSDFNFFHSLYCDS